MSGQGIEAVGRCRRLTASLARRPCHKMCRDAGSAAAVEACTSGRDHRAGIQTVVGPSSRQLSWRRPWAPSSDPCSKTNQGTTPPFPVQASALRLRQPGRYTVGNKIAFADDDITLPPRRVEQLAISRSPRSSFAGALPWTNDQRIRRCSLRALIQL